MRKILAIGSIGIIAIIVLTSFSSVASAKTVDRNELIKQVKAKLENDDWYPGYLIVYIIVTLLLIFTPFN